MTSTTKAYPSGTSPRLERADQMQQDNNVTASVHQNATGAALAPTAALQEQDQDDDDDDEDEDELEQQDQEGYGQLIVASTYRWCHTGWRRASERTGLALAWLFSSISLES